MHCLWVVNLITNWTHVHCCKSSLPIPQYIKNAVPSEDLPSLETCFQRNNQDTEPYNPFHAGSHQTALSLTVSEDYSLYTYSDIYSKHIRVKIVCDCHSHFFRHAFTTPTPEAFPGVIILKKAPPPRKAPICPVAKMFGRLCSSLSASPNTPLGACTTARLPQAPLPARERER